MQLIEKNEKIEIYMYMPTPHKNTTVYMQFITACLANRPQVEQCAVRNNSDIRPYLPSLKCCALLFRHMHPEKEHSYQTM